MSEREREEDREIDKERDQVFWYQFTKKRNGPKTDAHNFFPQGSKDISIIPIY